MSKETLGVLVHGAGWVAGEHVKAFAANPHTRVVAISSRKQASCERKAAEAGLTNVAFYTDYEKALAHEGVDIVSVCTPQQLHAENTIAAAEAGKNIVIEKPIANNPAEMRAMAAAVKKAGVKTVVSFVLRWNPLFKTIKSMVADDALGNVYCVETDYQHDIASWWTGYEDARTKKLGVSAMLTGGCHALDAARWFAGRGQFEAATPVEIFAYAGGWRKGRDIEYNYFSNSFQKAPPLEYDDLEIVLIRFDNGVLGKVSVNYGCVMPYTFPIEVFGDRGNDQRQPGLVAKVPRTKGLGGNPDHPPGERGCFPPSFPRANRSLRRVHLEQPGIPLQPRRRYQDARHCFRGAGIVRYKNVR